MMEVRLCGLAHFVIGVGLGRGVIMFFATMFLRKE